MNLRHIEIIHAVYVTGTVSAAAKALNVSQPTVSKTLRHAEDKLGFTVFNRLKGRLHPTEQGRRLFEEIQPIFKQLSQLDQAIHNISQVRRQALRIAMIPAIGLELGPKVIAQFCRKYPSAHIEAETLHSADIISALHNNEIDIGLVFDAPKLPGLSLQHIGEIDFVLIKAASHAGVSPESAKLSALALTDLITLDPKSYPGRQLQRKLASILEDSAHPQIYVDTYFLAKTMVQQGAGTAIIDSISALSGDRSSISIQRFHPRLKIKLDSILRPESAVPKNQTDFIKIFRKFARDYAFEE